MMRSCILQSWTHSCIFVRSVGAVTGDDWREMIHHLMSTECYELGFSVVHDMRFADFTTTTQDMLKPGRASVEPIAPGRLRKVAMVAADTLGYGLMGVVARLRERDHHKPRAFLRMDEALAWIDRSEFGAAFPEEAEQVIRTQLAAQRTQVTMLKSGMKLREMPEERVLEHPGVATR